MTVILTHVRERQKNPMHLLTIACASPCDMLLSLAWDDEHPERATSFLGFMRVVRSSFSLMTNLLATNCAKWPLCYTCSGHDTQVHLHICSALLRFLLQVEA